MQLIFPGILILWNYGATTESRPYEVLGIFESYHGSQQVGAGLRARPHTILTHSPIPPFPHYPF